MQLLADSQTATLALRHRGCDGYGSKRERHNQVSQNIPPQFFSFTRSIPQALTFPNTNLKNLSVYTLTLGRSFMKACLLEVGTQVMSEAGACMAFSP
jgi:hypothetical protein